MHAVSDATPVYYGVPSHHRVHPHRLPKGRADSALLREHEQLPRFHKQNYQRLERFLADLLLAAVFQTAAQNRCSGRRFPRPL